MVLINNSDEDDKDEHYELINTPTEDIFLIKEDNSGIKTPDDFTITEGHAPTTSIFTDLEEVPQGRHLGLFSTIILFISRIIGSGIWATPAAVFAGTGGNPALFFLLWLISALVAFAGLFCYLELGSLIPRSGGTKVFLEYIYPRPKLFITVVYGIYTLFFGISLTNALIFGKYLMSSMGFEADFIDSTKWSNYIGILLIIVTGLIHGVSLKHGIFVQNFLGALKLVLVMIMTLTGLYVLLVPSRLSKIENQLDMTKFFHFEDSSVVNVSTIISAFLSCVFSFDGWNAVHTVSSEIKDPTRTLKVAGPLSLMIVLTNYILINIAYLKVVPHENLMDSSPLVGSILFEKVLGYRLGKQFVTCSIALSAASTVFVVVYSISRMNQEIFRDGYLPFSSTMASNFKHTNTPLYSLLLCVLLTTFWLVVLPPNGESFNYVVSLESFPGQIFLLLVVVGVFIIRKRNPDEPAPIRSSLVGNSFIILICSVVIISPFFSKITESSPTYIKHLPPYYIASLLLLFSGALFYSVKFYVLPLVFNYDLKEESETHEDGLTLRTWVKT